MVKTNNKNNIKSINSKKTNSSVKKKSTKKKIVVDDVVKKEIVDETDAKLVKKNTNLDKDITAKIPVKKSNTKKTINTSKDSTTRVPIKKVNTEKKELTKEELIKERKERNRKKYQNQQKKYQGTSKNKEKKIIEIDEQVLKQEEKKVVEIENHVEKKEEVLEQDADLVKKVKVDSELENKTIETIQREERKEKRKKEKKPINLTQTLVNIREKTTDRKIPIGKTKDDKKSRFKRFIKEAIIYSVLLTVVNTICISTIDYFNFLRLFDDKVLNIIVTILISLIFNFFIAFMVDYFVTVIWLNKRRKEDGEQNGDNRSFEEEYRENIKD